MGQKKRGHAGEERAIVHNLDTPLRPQKRAKSTTPSAAEQQVPMFSAAPPPLPKTPRQLVQPTVTNAATKQEAVHTTNPDKKKHATNKTTTPTTIDLTATHGPAPPLKRPTASIIPPRTKATTTIDLTKNPSSTAAPAEHPPLPTLPPELAHLAAKYVIHEMSILTSASLSAKVSTLLAHLERFSFADLDAKPGVVALRARGDATSKLVSVVELAKREIEKGTRGSGDRAGIWYQYSRVGGEVREFKDKAKDKSAGAGAGRVLGNRTATSGEKEKEDVGEEDESGFENMPLGGEPQRKCEEGRNKVRAVPVMIIYMSRVRIPEFKTVFSEQSNSKD